MKTTQIPDTPRRPARIVIFGLVWAVVWPSILAATLYITSGEWNWPVAWAYLVMYALILAVGTLVIPREQDFWEERTQIKENTKSWDKILAGPTFAVIWFGIYIVAGLGRRFGWSGEVSLGVQIGAVVAAGLGYSLAVWAMATNRFYSRYVRIQTERGHTVVTTGPYRFVRHPGYAGITVFMAASGLALGSLWTLIPAGIVIVILVVRTVLEDRTLIAELPGYEAYAHRMRYRLLPGVW
jgi:protein-S-isoprenylcysteine O-methyltransferase Ste14